MRSLNIVYTGEEDEIVNQSYEDEHSTIIPYPCSLSCSCNPYHITFTPGSYFIELYGASGGNTRYEGKEQRGGLGGVVSAILTIHHKKEYYLYIGGEGINEYDTSTCGRGGYNGGGDPKQNRGGGGGSTDLRQHLDDIQSRILVAGAGGGAFASSGAQSNGGDGGGLIGSLGDSYDKYVACVGSQNDCILGQEDDKGIFGQGSSQSIDSDYGNGGGGYWGGGSANGCGGGGGSSYYGKLLLGKTRSGVNKGNGYAIIQEITQYINFCTYNNEKHSFLSLLHLSVFLINIQISSIT